MRPSLGLDHVFLQVHDLDAVLALFHGQLGLPISWPARAERFARYAWVNAGNVQVELWQARGDGAPRQSFVAGLALWPEDVDASRSALQAQGIRCKEPRPWRTPGPQGEALNFTNCLVLDASAPQCDVFFCQWHPGAPIAPWPKDETTVQRRARWARALVAASGSGVGIQGLRAIHMQTPDVVATSTVWQALAGARGIAAPGVDLVLVPGGPLRVEALVFTVADLARAQAHLDRHGLRHDRDAGGVLWIDRAQTFGLCLGLTPGA